jgi:hypothetical protein
VENVTHFELHESTVKRLVEFADQLEMMPSAVLEIMIEKALEEDETTKEVEDPFFAAVTPFSVIYGGADA